MHYPSRDEVYRFLDQTVRPAIEEVTAVFVEKGLNVVNVPDPSNDSVTLEIGHGEERPFIYQVQMKGFFTPSFARGGMGSKQLNNRRYYRAEVHLSEGSQDYDPWVTPRNKSSTTCSISTNGICSSCIWCVDRGVGGGYNYRPSRSTPRHLIRRGRGASERHATRSVARWLQGHRSSRSSAGSILRRAQVLSCSTRLHSSRFSRCISPSTGNTPRLSSTRVAAITPICRAGGLMVVRLGSIISAKA